MTNNAASASSPQVITTEQRTALTQAYIENAMLLDRTIISLASGGIGLLVTVMGTADRMSGWTFSAFILTCVLFIAAVVGGLWNYRANKPYLQALCAGRMPDDAAADRRDRWLWIVFCCGLLSALVAGCLALRT